MVKDLTSILSKVAKIGVATTLAAIGINNIIDYRNLANLRNEYSKEIYDKSKSLFTTNYFNYKMMKIDNIEDLNEYYNTIHKDKLKKTSEFYRDISGSISIDNMRVVSQKKLDSSFMFEKEWNEYVKSGYDIKKSRPLLKKMREISKKNSSKYYIKEINNVKNPEDVMSELIFMRTDSDKNIFGENDYSASFRVVHKNKKDDCDGGTIYAAGALYDNGFAPYELVLKEEGEIKNILHAVFIYKTDEGNFGTLGINKEDMLYPRYNSIEKLVEKINDLMDNSFSTYEIYNIEKPFPDFIHNNKNNDPTVFYYNPKSICNE